MPDEPTPTVPHIDWWRDGRVIIQLVTLILGFAGTWVTVYYQNALTREKVSAVEERQGHRLDRVEGDSSAVRSIIVGDK